MSELEEDTKTLKMLSECSQNNHKALDWFADFQASMTLEKALRAENQISYYRKFESFECDLALDFLVASLSDAFAGSYKMNSDQITRVVSEIKASYWYLRLEEIVYVFSKIKNGAYGDVNYSGIDQARIMKCLAQYDTTERVSQFVDYHTSTKADDLFYGRIDTETKFAIAQRQREEYQAPERLQADIEVFAKLYGVGFIKIIGFQVAESEIIHLTKLYLEDFTACYNRIAEIKANKALCETLDENNVSANDSTQSLRGDSENAKKRRLAIMFINSLELNLEKPEIETLAQLYIQNYAEFQRKMASLCESQSKQGADNHQNTEYAGESETQSKTQSEYQHPYPFDNPTPQFEWI